MMYYSAYLPVLIWFIDNAIASTGTKIKTIELWVDLTLECLCSTVVSWAEHSLLLRLSSRVAK